MADEHHRMADDPECPTCPAPGQRPAASAEPDEPPHRRVPTGGLLTHCAVQLGVAWPEFQLDDAERRALARLAAETYAAR